ncbi:Holliday junction branch migration protein RuvA [Candidatus Peribacteria bacterium]|nr:Holliday junction branch migration protein RuvA [Candidatus Peribacteria bacterium]
MIGLLTGTVRGITGSRVLLMTSGGVGYSVTAAGELLSHCRLGESLTCYIYTAVRENDITLYGFASEGALRLFEQVIQVSGIGPKVGIAIASVPQERVYSAVELGDISLLKSIPGLGPKTAKKLVLELQGRLILEPNSTAQQPKSPAMEDALEALVGLGYEPKTVHQVLDTAPESLTTEELVRYFLTHPA